jgi:hypothetical protein
MICNNAHGKVSESINYKWRSMELKEFIEKRFKSWNQGHGGIADEL